MNKPESSSGATPKLTKRSPSTRHPSQHTQRRYRGTRRSEYVTRRELKGGKMDVPTNPPSVAYQPWMPVTVVHAGVSGEITITVSDLINQLISQIDPTKHAILPPDRNNRPTAVINIRLRSVRAWNMTGKMIALSVDDFSDADKAIADVDTLCGLVDTGSASHVPAVGYDLPESHKNIVLRNGTDNSTDKSAVLYHVISGSDDSCIIYTNIFWKCDGPAKFSQFQDKMMETILEMNKNIKSSTKIVDKSADRLKDIKELCKDILHDLPSDKDSQLSYLTDAIRDFEIA